MKTAQEIIDLANAAGVDPAFGEKAIIVGATAIIHNLEKIIAELEEEPLEYKGRKPNIVSIRDAVRTFVHLSWYSDTGNNFFEETHHFCARTRTEVVTKWNELVRGVK